VLGALAFPSRRTLCTSLLFTKFKSFQSRCIGKLKGRPKDPTSRDVVPLAYGFNNMKSPTGIDGIEVTAASILPSLPLVDQMASSQLDGKVALVTGSGRGIGAGIAIELGARGASVIVRRPLYPEYSYLNTSLTIFRSTILEVLAQQRRLSKRSRLQEEGR
jgi:hypothetical protein